MTWILVLAHTLWLSTAAMADRSPDFTGAAVLGRAPLPLNVFFVEGIASTPPGKPSLGDQYLVGDQPVGAFAGHEGEIATFNRTWIFTLALVGDQVFDEGTSEQYLHTGQSLLLDGLWVDSAWRRLTNVRPQWQVDASIGVIGHDLTLTSDQHGKWLPVSPATGPITITLPSPFADGLESMGIEIVLEMFDGAAFDATLVTEGGALMQLPDGSQTTQFVLPRNTPTPHRYHVFKLTAGSVVSGYAWYLSEGP